MSIIRIMNTNDEQEFRDHQKDLLGAFKFFSKLYLDKGWWDQVKTVLTS